MSGNVCFFPEKGRKPFSCYAGQGYSHISQLVVQVYKTLLDTDLKSLKEGTVNAFHIYMVFAGFVSFHCLRQQCSECLRSWRSRGAFQLDFPRTKRTSLSGLRWGKQLVSLALLELVCTAAPLQSSPQTSERADWEDGRSPGRPFQ